jgi:hypothetical protein
VQKFYFLIPLIYILFSSELISQNVQLEIGSHSEEETKIVDALLYQKVHADYASVKREVDSVHNALFAMGYIEHKLDKIIKTSDSTFFANIELKKKYNHIHIYYDKTLVNQTILRSVSKEVFDTYFVLPFNILETSLNYMNSKIAEAGFPFSKLRLSNIKIKDANRLMAELIIDAQEQKRLINKIIIKGYKKFPTSYLLHYLKIKPNQIFNLKKIEKKSEQLNDLRFANQIKSPEVLFSKDSTTLYMYLEKSRSNNFDGYLGFGTNEETSKLEFDGYINLNLTNNLNYGESFRLQYKSDENDQKTFKTELSLPYLLNSPIGVDLQLHIFKKDSTFTTVNQSAKIHYQINSKNKLYLGIHAIQSNNLLSIATTALIADYKSNFFTLAYQFIKPQSYNSLFPVNTSLFIETGLGNRKNLDNTEKQSLFTLDAFKIINLNPKNSFYIGIEVENIISDTYFENELLRFGGINSIRGFEENSILASFYGAMNTEYRLQLSNSLYLHSIVDIGYFENKITNTKEKLYGYGLGFGILTKSGLLKFNYANGKNENTPFKLSNSKIHISLTTNF